jgi:hypothetical protein
MANGNRIIRIHVMNDGTWNVDFKENPEYIWKTVSEYFSKREGYKVVEELKRIWARSLGQAIDIIQKASEEIRKMPT